MPRLEEFRLRIQTGEKPGPNRPQYEINGFTVDFDSLDGSASPGETMDVVGAPRSFPHALVLVGPESGEWAIDGIEATYECDGAEPYTVRMGAVTLDEHTSLNIWYEPPLPTFDV